MISQGKSKRRPSGGKYKKKRKKKKFEGGKESLYCRIGQKRTKTIDSRGKNKKKRLVSSNTMNLSNPETGKTEKVEIENVIDNPANQHFVRRNLITKGSVVETDKGKAKVTSRPGQKGVLEGILLEE
ncbi:MAG: 30S ribosomal protein S8e [Candidatus Aenigmatarchaeota archaeon]